MQALGFIETKGLIAAIEAADAMLKAAEVTLTEKTYVGGGLVSIAVTGGVAAVKAAVEAGAAAVKQIDETLLVSEHVIPRPHDEINSLIVPIKIFAGEKVENTAVIDFKAVGASVEEPASEAYSEAAASEENTEETEVKDLPPVIQTISQDVRLEEINKESIDKFVLEYGLEKTLQVLSKIKLSKLRNLARKYESMGIKGRTISKADKKMIIAEFKEYYGKNQ